jgi:uncharacterized protein YodC (DUF2158 family)
MPFEPGDVVTLKSGGHPMTVASIAEEDIYCLWVGDDGELYRQSIPAIALTIVDLAEIEEEEEQETEEADEDDEEDEDDDEESEDDEERGEKRRKKRR